MSQIKQVYKTWTEIKAFLGAPKNLELQYHEFTYYYKIFVLEASVEYFTELWKDTSQVKGIDVTQNNLDKTDFEDNYKTGANQAIEMDVTVENDVNIDNFGSGTSIEATNSDVVQKLGDVIDALENLDVTVGTRRYKPKFYSNGTEVTLSDSSETELVNVNINGQLDAVSANFSHSNIEFIIYIDSEEVMRIDFDDFQDSSKFNSNDDTFPLFFSNNGKQIIIKWQYPVDVTSNIIIKAKRTGTPSSIHKDGVMVLYREKIT